MADDDAVPDPRLVDADRITLSRPRPLVAELLAKCFPPDEYPSIDNEQDMWLRLAEERLQREHCGGLPPEMYEAMETLRYALEHSDRELADFRELLAEFEED